MIFDANLLKLVLGKGARFLTLVSLFFLFACASNRAPFSSVGVAKKSSLDAIAGRVSIGERVIWGGVIVASNNTSGGLEIEVQAYPLNNQQRPTEGFNSRGRVLVKMTEVVETVDFAPGRLITISGQYGGLASAQIGVGGEESPVLETKPGDIHVWTSRRLLIGSVEYLSTTAVSIGLGVPF